MPRLLLASTSRYRRELLERLGVPFECRDPGIDEGEVLAGPADPIALARAVAAAKADAVSEQCDQAIVIGCDQVCALGNDVLGKPGSKPAALTQLLRLQGAEHALITAVALRQGNKRSDFVDVTRLLMRRLGQAELERYVAADNPIDCAGSYKIERAGIALFERIQGDDHTAIIGLGLLKLSASLREFGLSLP